VTRVTRLVSRGVERPWLERLLAVACFVTMLGGLVGVFRYIGPRIIYQGQELISRFSTIDAEQEFQKGLDLTVGAYLFRKEFGESTDPRFQQELEKRLGSGARFSSDYHEFPSLKASIESAFDARFQQRQSASIRADLVREGVLADEFDQWLLNVKAPADLAAGDSEDVADGARWRYLNDVRQDPERIGTLHDEWKEKVVSERLAQLRRSPVYEQQFREFFKERQADDPAAIPYDYETYQKLIAAYPKGESAFAETLGSQEKSDADERQAAEQGFKRSLQRELADQWWKESSAALFIRHHVTNNLGDFSAHTAGFLREAVAYGLTIPVQLGMALLLSFFIMIDYPNLKKGAARLQHSRVGRIYDEIMPGIIKLGHLVAMAFYAQGMIAVVNSMLTFVAIYFLGIDHGFVLAATVFVCSFIPVIGVVLSALPIAIVAIVQPGGSLMLAVWAILAIVVIHLIESSILSPRIVGHVLHLHPVIVFVVLLIGEHFFGFWGLLLGVPVAVYIISYVILQEDTPPPAEPAATI
jgi:predicted PurR-regulated permease PerM